MVLPVLFFLYEGLKAQRHVLLLMEIAAVPVARDLEVASARQLVAEFARSGSENFRPGNGWPVAMPGSRCSRRSVLTRLFVAARPSRITSRWAEASRRKLVAFLRDHPDRFQRPLTTTWNAGPLLWNMRPDFRVSFDDRGDFYGDETVFSFVDMTTARAGWEDKLEKGNYDSALLDPYLAAQSAPPSRARVEGGLSRRQHDRGLLEGASACALI